MARGTNLATASLHKTEMEVLTRYNAGQAPADIAAAMGISASTVGQAIGYQSESEGLRQRANVESGSQRLAEALKGAGAFAERYREVRKLSATALDPLPIGRACPALAAPARAADPRPPATSRDPCPRCGTRGELGCAHQQPWLAEDLAELVGPAERGAYTR